VEKERRLQRQQIMAATERKPCQSKPNTQTQRERMRRKREGVMGEATEALQSNCKLWATPLLMCVERILPPKVLAATPKTKAKSGHEGVHDVCVCVRVCVACGMWHVHRLKVASPSSSQTGRQLFMPLNRLIVASFSSCFLPQFGATSTCAAAAARVESVTMA